MAGIGAGTGLSADLMADQGARVVAISSGHFNSENRRSVAAVAASPSPLTPHPSPLTPLPQRSFSQPAADPAG